MRGQATIVDYGCDELIAAFDAIGTLDSLDVEIHSFWRDLKDFSNLPVGFSGYEPRGDFQLPGSQFEMWRRVEYWGRLRPQSRRNVSGRLGHQVASRGAEIQITANNHHDRAI
jgi:hypothetical protein